MKPLNFLKSKVCKSNAQVLLLVISLLLVSSVFATLVFATGNALIYTGKYDYAPTEVVDLHGTGFNPNSQITIAITRPDCITDTGTSTSDAEGDFSYSYDLNLIDSPGSQCSLQAGLVGLYDTEATDGENTAYTVFSDSRTIDSATLNGASSVTVAPSASITAAVSVTTTGSGEDNDWESTSYRIGSPPSGSFTCVNTPDHTFPAGTFIESFSITAPASAGLYDVEFRAHNGGSCTSTGQSSILLLADSITVTSPSVCGNSDVESGEGCDDGNTANGDGCNSGCQIESGWGCSGEPSSCSTICGNGILSGSETCDDSNTNNNDGCSSSCAVESGWTCDNSPMPSFCSANNPSLPDSCGIDVTLIMDVSGSIDSGELTTMKTAFKDFVDAFLPATPTEIALVSFDDTATLNLNYSTDATTIKAAIDAAVGGGATNWEDSFEVANEIAPGRAKANLYLFASDGDPNRYGDGPTVADAITATAQAKIDADGAKLNGTRIIALGIGGSVNTANLLNISGPGAVITSDFDDLAVTLANVAAELCGGTITVKKNVDGVPTAGWTFTPTVSAGDLVAPLFDVTDGSGLAGFDVSFDGDDTATVDITETVQAGYVLETATCKKGVTPLGVFDGTDGVNGIAIGKNDIVSCEFNNSLHTYCGDQITQNQPPNDDNIVEQCDANGANGVPCVPGYGDSCQYCSSGCQIVELTGPFCGDNIENGEEQCDNNGANGVPCVPGYGSECDYCSSECDDVHVTGPFCGDEIVNGAEQCDDSNDVDWDSCSNLCIANKKLLVNASPSGAVGGTFHLNVTSPGECTPVLGTYNTAKEFMCRNNTVVNVSAPQSLIGSYFFKFFSVQGNHTTAIISGNKSIETIVDPGVNITLNYVLDNKCPLVEVVIPPDTDPITYFNNGITVKGTVSDPTPSSGIKNVRTAFHDSEHSWDDPTGIPPQPLQYNMTYNATSGFWEYLWDTTNPNVPKCSIVQADIFGEDYAGNGADHECADTNQFGVDNEAPNTTKEVGMPNVSCSDLNVQGCDFYVTPDTDFTLVVDECGSGVNKTYYTINGGSTQTYTGPFSLPAECGQLVEYWSVDNLGNTEEKKNEIDHVDNAAPTTEKTFSEPTVDLVEGDNYYVTQSTQITLTATDHSPNEDGCPVGVALIHYEIWWDSDNDGSFETLTHSDNVSSSQVQFYFNEDSKHLIKWYAVDKLGNAEQQHTQEHAVDTQPPQIVKSIIGPSEGTCPPLPENGPQIQTEQHDENVCFVDGVTEIHVEATDPQPHPVNQVTCDWDYDVIGGEKIGQGQQNINAPFNINFPEESQHVLTITCEDALGNSVTDIETFYVDKTPPVTSKEYGQPFYSEEGVDYATSQTPITLTVDDAGPHKSGIQETKYRVTLLESNEPCFSDQICQQQEGAGEWNTYGESPFNIGEESCHLIQFYSKDNVDKTEVVKQQCVFVDNTDPTVSKDIGDPKIPTEQTTSPYTNQIEQSFDVQDQGYYVTQNTPIELSCEDTGNHPVDHAQIYYRYFLNGNEQTDGWALYQGTFQYSEDSYHDLYYYCVDALGNAGQIHHELDIVDTQAPEVNKEVGNPKVPCQNILDITGISTPLPECHFYVTQETPIMISCIDGEPHPVDDVSISYRIRFKEDFDDLWVENWSAWTTIHDDETTVYFTEDSLHQIEYNCSDSLGNTFGSYYEIDAVESEAPQLVKTIGEPKVVKMNTTCEPEEESNPEVVSGRQSGSIYAAGPLSISVDDPCAGATQPEQCAYLDSSSLPDFVEDTIISQGGNPTSLSEGCGKVLVLSSGNPNDADSDLSTNMGNDGCGLNPDAIATHDCTTLTGFTPDANSVVLAVSSEWPEYEGSSFTDWMQIFQSPTSVDISINDWGTAPTIPYGPSSSGTKTLATIESTGAANLKVADSGDSIYDTALIVVPDSCFSEIESPVFCGDEVTQPGLGEECDDGNTNNGDGCSSTCQIEEEEEEPQPFCGDNSINQNFEQCDDGNNADNDGCSSDCQIETPDCVEEELTYINQSTVISFDCVDAGNHPVDDVTIFYRTWLDGNEPGEWNQYNGEHTEFDFNEDSLHYVQYYCVDSLGNGNGSQIEPHIEIDVVDSQPPILTKELIGKNISFSELDQSCGEEWNAGCYYINQSTQINVTAVDPLPHPVDSEKVFCEYWVTEQEQVLTSVSIDLGEHHGPFQVTQPFNFPEDSRHTLHCWANDSLGNQNDLWELDVVDSKPPITVKTIEGPKYNDTCIEGGNCWITQNSQIFLDCEDQQPHPVNDVTLHYQTAIDGVSGQWAADEDGHAVIQFEQDSNHSVKWYCVDRLGNAEEVRAENDTVDTEGPQIVKSVDDNTVMPGTEVTICANVTDIKQTQDGGVGVYDVWANLTVADDPFHLVLEQLEGTNTYCTTWAAPEINDEVLQGKCLWNLHVNSTDLLGNFNEENGIQIIVDHADPQIPQTLKPHAGQYYRDGKNFTIYAPTIDFGGDEDILDEDDYCKASGVRFCKWYAFDYPFEAINQSEVKNYWDYLLQLEDVMDSPYVVYLGSTPVVPEGNKSVCKGSVMVPEESGLTDVVFLAYEVEDNAGNNYSALATDASEDLITMNIDNELGVMITNYGALPGPVTSEDVIQLKAWVNETESGFADCWADIYKCEESEEEVDANVLIEQNPSCTLDTGYDLDGHAVAEDQCEISGILPNGLESGDYQVKVNARDIQFNVESDWADMVVDNTRPTMSIVAPHADGTYGVLVPMSVNTEDSSGIVSSSVRVRFHEIGLFGTPFCLGGCEDTGWINIPMQSNGLYASIVNLTEYDISTSGRYVFDAIACDPLYVPNNSPVGTDMNQDRNSDHCRQISVHDDVSEEVRPQCDDGLDNDLDGMVDYWNGDPNCEDASDDNEAA